LAATLDFTSFFTMAFLGPHTFFTAGLFWIRYIIPCFQVSGKNPNRNVIKNVTHDSNILEVARLT